VLLLLAFSTFLFGLHWLVLLLCVARTRNERIQCTVHFAVGLVAFLMLGGGGAYARSGTSTACSNNQSMSRECLWEEQTPTYQGIYILHFVGGAWILASVVVDGLHMPGWFYCIVRRTPMRSFYTSNSPWPAYTLVMIVLVTVVNFTWTGWVQWSTHPHLAGDVTINVLLAILLGECLGAAVLAWLGLSIWVRAIRTTGTVAGSSAG